MQIETFTTGDSMGTLAGKVLANPNSTKDEKSLAGSDLSLINKGNKPSDEIKSLAGKVDSDKNSTAEGRELSSSILGQSK